MKYVSCCISISGKDVIITAKEDKFDQTIHKNTTTETFGIGISVNTNVASGNIGIGYEKKNTIYDKETHNTSTSSANINANNITISTAGQDGNPQGNINIIGSNLNGSEIALSGKDVNIKAHQTTNKTTESEETKIDRVGFQVGIGGGGLLTVGGYGSGGNDFATAFPMNTDQKNSFSQSTINTGSNLVGNNINITTANDKGNTQGNINIIGSNLSATNTTNLTATNVNIKGSEDVHINGGFGFGYDVTVGSNINLVFPTIVDYEAFANANMDISLGTNINNSSIKSNNINISANKDDKGGGDISIIGGNIYGKQTNINAENNLDIKTQTENNIKISGNAQIIGESMASILANNVNLDGALQVSLDTNSAKQSGIQSQDLQIKVNNQTKLTGSYISAEEKSTITTKSIKTNPLLHLGISTNQKIGIKGNANIIGGLMAGSFALMDLVFKTDLLKQPETIGNILFVEGTLNNGKWIDGEIMITPKIHSSSVSKNITIKTNLIDGILTQRGEQQEEREMDGFLIKNEDIIQKINKGKL